MQGDLFRRRRSNASSTASTRHSRLVSAPEMDFLDDTDANGIDEWGVNGDLCDTRGDSEEDEIITQVRTQQRKYLVSKKFMGTFVFYMMYHAYCCSINFYVMSNMFC